MTSAEVAQITASSSYSQTFTPQYSRLHGTGDCSSGYGAWASESPLVIGQWIQVDIGETAHIYKVATQGRNACPQWVTSYQLATSQTSDEEDFIYVTSSADGAVVTFNGNSDSETVVLRAFSPRVARLVRLYPQTWHVFISLRWEVYGCLFGVTCPSLVPPVSADVSTSDVLAGSSVDVTCRPGFHFGSTHSEDVATTNCRNTQQWDFDVNILVCSRKPCYRLVCTF